jgi:hypothetical protein
VDRGIVDQKLSLSVGLSDTGGAENNGFHCRSVCYTGENDVCSVRDGRRRRGNVGSVGANGLGFFWTSVPNREGASCPQQAPCHGQAHETEPNKAEHLIMFSHSLLHLSGSTVADNPSRTPGPRSIG